MSSVRKHIFPRLDIQEKVSISRHFFTQQSLKNMEIEEDYMDYVDEEFEDQENEITEVWDNWLLECIGRYVDCH